MSLISFVLMLVVAAVVWYGVTLAFAGKWKELFMLALALILAIWILSALGLTLPSLPAMR